MADNFARILQLSPEENPIDAIDAESVREFEEDCDECPEHSNADEAAFIDDPNMGALFQDGTGARIVEVSEKSIFDEPLFWLVVAIIVVMVISNG